MPPTAGTSKGARPFKPPTRVSGASASSATIRKPSNATAKGSRVSNASNTNARPPVDGPVEVTDSEDEYGSDMEDIDTTRMTTMTKSTNARRTSAAAPTTPRRRSTAVAAGADNDPLALIEDDEDAPTIPRPLLTRILFEGFEDKEMKINKEAMSVVELYTRVFVKEAMARSKQQTTEHSQRLSNGAVDSNWLQVEDLEKIAPQLMLDF